MLVRSVIASYKCGRMLWNTARVDKKFVCINAAMNQSTEAGEITDVQAASLKNDMCLLVDERDNVIGTASKRECHRVGPDGMVPLHRAFSVLMFNSAGELLVQKRASQKVTYPNAITNTCCSHPLLIDGVPEDVTTAAIRRLNEELGIPKQQLNREDFTLISRFIYADPGDGVWGEYELDHVLILRSDVQVKPNPNEIEDVKYVARSKMDSFIANQKDPITPWFKLIHQHMLPYWWDNLHRLKDIAEPDTIHSFVNKDL
ncbi:isopentenyl-diphosphate Delta-isomerase 1 [Spodoptera frugiperda]|uniref:isopentenyl-diphosphate Delta-isomerase n=1 Tax=Spodoptera frugiperda TaxID=7108 RepID=A0A9R0EPS4_SPOFR|nr:isopentenyl-diphosphate Delta-isomerase 1 [Spodoptera frugiperda]